MCELGMTCLKIAADNEQVNAVPVLLEACLLDTIIDCIQSAMALILLSRS
jgi:hypothetical protein